MNNEKIKSKYDLYELLSGTILIFIAITIAVAAFMQSVLFGILFSIVSFYIYSMFFYTVHLFDRKIELHYLWQKKSFNVDDVDYLEIVSGGGALSLSLSFKLKNEKKRINFGHGNSQNLLRILNFAKSNKIRIIDKKNLLKKYDIDKTALE